MLFNARKDVFEIGIAGSKTIEWLLNNQGKQGEYGDRKRRIQDRFEYYFGNTNGMHERLNGVKGMGGESHTSS